VASSFTISLAAELSELGKLDPLLAAYGEQHELSEYEGLAVRMVVEELLTNVVMHGGSGAHRIAIALHGSPETLEIEVRDDGLPFDPTAGVPPPPTGELADRQPGSLGLHLVRSMMDSIDYQRTGSHNIVRLTRSRSP